MKHLKFEKIPVKRLSKSKSESFLDISTEILPEDDDAINSEDSDINFENVIVQMGSCVSLNKLSTTPNINEHSIQLLENPEEISLRNTNNKNICKGEKCEENAFQIQNKQSGNSKESEMFGNVIFYDKSFEIVKPKFDYEGRDHSAMETKNVNPICNGLSEVEELRKRGSKPKNLDIQPKTRGRKSKTLNTLEDKKPNRNNILKYYNIQYKHLRNPVKQNDNKIFNSYQANKIHSDTFISLIRNENNSENEFGKNKTCFKNLKNQCKSGICSKNLKKNYMKINKRVGKRKSLTDKNTSTNTEGILKYLSVKNKDINQNDNLKAPMNKNTNTQSIEIKNSSTISEEKNIQINLIISDTYEKRSINTEETSTQSRRQSSPNSRFTSAYLIHNNGNCQNVTGQYFDKVNVAKNIKSKMNRRMCKGQSKNYMIRNIPKNRLEEALDMINSSLWEDRNLSCNPGIHSYWESNDFQASKENIKLKFARQYLLRRDWSSLCTLLHLPNTDLNILPILSKYAILLMAQTDSEQFDAVVQYITSTTSSNLFNY
ncbi:uncharacterized protein ACRADG_012252 isoform 1-T3 [Cochliomyia hominivorax]